MAEEVCYSSVTFFKNPSVETPENNSEKSIYAVVKTDRSHSAQTAPPTGPGANKDEEIYSKIKTAESLSAKTEPPSAMPVKEEPRHYSNKLAAVCLGLLCAGSLAIVVALSVYYNLVSQRDNEENRNLSETNSLMKEKLAQLTANYSRLTVVKETLLQDYNNLTVVKETLLQDYNNLTVVKEKLQTDYNNLTVVKETLLQDYNNLTVVKETLQTDYNNLTVVKEKLQTEYTIMKDERDDLQSQVTGLNQALTEMNRTIATLNRYCPVTKPATLERACQSCPQGFVFYNTRCYFFSSEIKNWNDSRTACRSQGADLVIIESRQEQEFLWNLTRSPSKQSAWIGLTDQNKEGTWLWVDGTNLTVKYWANQQPDNWQGKEHCALIDITLSTDMEKIWNDVPCTGNNYRICERSF
ncbi:C-type lectin domain family 4 member M-like [Lepisosteus oculatus]|uniref:C-type lectin domain family 4 member M-like n=1 Tax=Lepisosteus oculatus TaxID=7918 RepID=UPI00371233EA